MKTRTSRWLLAILSEFIEGSCDSFIIVAGGSVASQSVGSTAALQWHQLLISSIVGGLIYAASFIKKNPTPITTADDPMGVVVELRDGGRTSESETGAKPPSV